MKAVDILTNSSLLFFPSESEEKLSRSMQTKPKKVIFASTDIRYRIKSIELSSFIETDKTSISRNAGYHPYSRWRRAPPLQ